MNRISAKLHFINRREHGFTFIELLIAIAISLAVGSSIAMFTLQVVNTSNTAQNRLIATKQVEYAVDIMSRDAAMVQYPYPLAPMDASGFTSTPGTSDLLTSALYFGWTSWDNANYIVTYWIDNSQLKRRLYRNGAQQSEMVVARNAVWVRGRSDSPTRYSYSPGTLTFILTCDVNGGLYKTDPSKDTQRSRTFQIVPRPM
jgi:prepilin-type N-terminal cleavage/methylation domain-containing protein